jgi:hypothetical protein
LDDRLYVGFVVLVMGDCGEARLMWKLQAMVVLADLLLEDVFDLVGGHLAQMECDLAKINNFRRFLSSFSLRFKL